MALRRVAPKCLRLYAENRLPHNIITRLNHFTLTRYGSHIPLPTLKPNLAASAPRLCTGWKLRLYQARSFTGLETMHRTGARKKIFLNKNIEIKFKELIKEICNMLKIEIIAMECHIDHVHLFLKCWPQQSPSNIMKIIKGIT